MNQGLHVDRSFKKSLMWSLEHSRTFYKKVSGSHGLLHYSTLLMNQVRNRMKKSKSSNETKHCFCNKSPYRFTFEASNTETKVRLFLWFSPLCWSICVLIHLDPAGFWRVMCPPFLFCQLVCNRSSLWCVHVLFFL